MEAEPQLHIKRLANGKRKCKRGGDAEWRRDSGVGSYKSPRVPRPWVALGKPSVIRTLQEQCRMQRDIELATGETRHAAVGTGDVGMGTLCIEREGGFLNDYPSTGVPLV